VVKPGRGAPSPTFLRSGSGPASRPALGPATSGFARRPSGTDRQPQARTSSAVDAGELARLVDLLDVDEPRGQNDCPDAVTLEFYERGALSAVVGVVDGTALRCNQRIQTVSLTGSSQRLLAEWLSERGVTVAEIANDCGSNRRET
jgi:hypothetical protein